MDDNVDVELVDVDNINSGDDDKPLEELEYAIENGELKSVY